ncbi:MAG: sensor histidine kinase [Balneolaceae bacterium]
MSEKNVFKKPGYSRLALRNALLTAAAISFLAMLLVYVLFDTALGRALLFGGLLFVIALPAAYGIFFIQLRKRMLKLRKILKNISAKRFEEYESVREEEIDELDELVFRAIRASNTVEKEIRRLNKIENYRKEFIGDISHELKTPIFAIQGFIETLLNGAVHDDEVNEVFLKKAMRNVNRLTYLTKDLMEISRLETGELKSNFRDVYLKDLILDVVESLQYKAQNEEVDIILESIDKNIQVLADRNQVKQVLINLIENAIKYNKPNGRVVIGVNDYKPEKEKVLVYIQDTGIGIDTKDIPRVTERFFRVDKSRSREKGGTGLGLSIVKHIIEAHGEKLMIDSSKEGTTFSFTLSRSNHVLL